MKNVILETIDTKVSQKKVANLLTEKKTFFLNGEWGSGKTDFIKGVEEQCPKKKFITIKFWEKKSNESVMRTLYRLVFSKIYYVSIFLAVSCIVASILLTKEINLGLTSLIPWLKNSYVYFFVGITSLIIAVGTFCGIKSDTIILFFLDRKCVKKSLSEKVLLIDDFDRLPKEDQEELYKIFNIFKEELTILFLGDIKNIAKNNDNYLSKIIDVRLELPYILHPESIWPAYFQQLEKILEKKINLDLQYLFINEQKNLRDRKHFNDYVNLIFFESNRLGHVQSDQQLLIIYLYLFKNNYYQNLKYVDKTRGIELLFDGIPDFSDEDEKNDIDILIKKILDSNTGYPPSFSEARQNYFILETVSNLGDKDAYEILENPERMKEALIEQGNTTTDFYSFITKEYINWEPTNLSRMLEEKNNINQTILNLEKASFNLIKENRYSDLVQFVIVQLIKREGKLPYSANSESHVISMIDFLDDRLKDMDVSQQLFFYDHIFKIKHSILYNRYIKQINEVITDDTHYRIQAHKSLLLSFKVNTATREIIPSTNWENSIIEKINALSDEEFVLFWKRFPFVDIIYKRDANLHLFQLTNIKVIKIIEEYDPPKYSDIEYRNYCKIIDFNLFKNRLSELSKSYEFEVKDVKIIDNVE